MSIRPAILSADSLTGLVDLPGDAPGVRHLDTEAVLLRGDALDWLRRFAACSVHAVVTDPPYGLIEYEESDHAKLRAGRGGVWRIPPSFDGARRRPVPRFTVLKPDDLRRLSRFFEAIAGELARVLVPGAHVFVAANPLLSSRVVRAFEQAGLEKRGEIVRLVQTLRGGDRPKGAHREFADVSAMPRSCWEPWALFRKPLEGTVAANLRRWGTGGLRRISDAEPFKDVIPCAPTRGREREIAPHPSLKPQRFLRQVVRASLPLGEGLVLDPFAGSGSTLAAAAAVGYRAIGIERDRVYADLAEAAFPELRDLVI